MKAQSKKHVAKPWAMLTILAGVFLVSTASPAFAQPRPGGIGIGGQIGEPSGFTVKAYNPGSFSYDFLAAWDLDNFLYLNVHGVHERQLNREENVHFFYGPGAFIGFRDRAGNQSDDVVAGISGTFGLNFLVERFEIYGRLTPRLSLTPDTDGDIGGGVGVRYYF